MILGLETSCDETAAALVTEAGEIRASVVASQAELHARYGGVVPEVASRNHLETVNAMIDQALSEAKVKPGDLSAIAVTQGPGLIGALLVGVSAAKAMAYALNLPLVPVHHLEGHATSVFLDQPELDVQYPLLLLIASGGHTQLYHVPEPPTQWAPNWLESHLVGHSLDDAAGEAFDKAAKILGAA